MSFVSNMRFTAEISCHETCHDKCHEMFLFLDGVKLKKTFSSYLVFTIVTA